MCEEDVLEYAGLVPTPLVEIFIAVRPVAGVTCCASFLLRLNGGRALTKV